MPAKDLRIVPDAGAAPLSPEQKRFNRLIVQVGEARALLAAWQQQIPIYHQAHVKRIVPLLDALRAARAEALRTLDALLNQPGWNRTEVATLSELICERAAELIGGNNADDDAEFRSLFEKHGDIDFDRAREAAREAFVAQIEAMTGRGFHQEAPGESGESAEAPPASPAPRPPKPSAAERRRELAAQQATQSVRQVYRQLASALHPDRETDPVLRLEKTAAMQRVNQAYEKNDLLGLLEMQRDAERLEGGAIRGIGGPLLSHYCKVLAEQLAGLKREVETAQAEFENDFGLDLNRAVDPMRLVVLVDQGWRQLTAMIAAQKQEQRLLGDRVLTRRWLKQARRHAREMTGDLF